MKEPSILVVDDDPDVLEMAGCFFREAGMVPLCAESGAEALGRIREGRFAAMLTDYNMPGMNGVELAEKALAMAPQLKIVMVTGHPSQELSECAAKAGVIRVLAKPLQLDDVLNLVGELIPVT